MFSERRGQDKQGFGQMCLKNRTQCIFASFYPIKLKIESRTDQSFSSRFPGCFSEKPIFGTPLAHILITDIWKITKVVKPCFIVGFPWFDDWKMWVTVSYSTYNVF